MDVSRRSELVLERLKTFVTFVCPLKFDDFVKHISQRLGNLGEFLEETATIAGESKETSDFLDSLGRSPIQDSLNVLWMTCFPGHRALEMPVTHGSTLLPEQGC